MSSLCGRCCRLFVYSLRPSQPRNRRSIRLGQWSNLGGKKRSMSLHSKDIPKEFYKKIPKVCVGMCVLVYHSLCLGNNATKLT